MKGLTTAKAAELQAEHGKNTLVQVKPPGAVRIFLRQFKDAMVLILLAATGISAALGEWTDAVTIVVIVLLNAILGFVQEYRTEKTLEALGYDTRIRGEVLDLGGFAKISDKIPEIQNADL